VTLSELANIGETLGGVAVLVSLIYLILEVKRSTKTARSASAWNATTAFAELCEGISHNRELSALVFRATSDVTKPEDLTPDEFAQYFMFCRSVLFKYEAQYFLWKEGTLSDEMWQTRRKWARSFFSQPIPARIWEIEKEQHQYSSGFIQSIESAVVTSPIFARQVVSGI